ncbi:MAG: hypothetical protein GY822_21675, partial [Deltaproteobacteria bacterium]|nr:hypothetical protein [Deltaproteobacteria bacterium]
FVQEQQEKHCTFKPKIDDASHRIMQIRLEAHREAEGRDKTAFDDLYQDAMRRHQKFRENVDDFSNNNSTLQKSASFANTRDGSRDAFYERMHSSMRERPNTNGEEYLPGPRDPVTGQEWFKVE